MLALSTAVSRADTASVVTAANTLLATSEAANPNATSTSTIPAVMTDSYTLAIAKQWTNLPGGTRNGPTIGGGPAALNTDLSVTVPTGQTVSPRAAAIALAQTALSSAGYNTMNEIRNADDVIRSTDNTQTWNYGNYHIAILGTPSTTTPWMLQISGHHLTYNITYNGPYVGATPMFIGSEPPNYFSIGTDLTSTEQAVVFGTDDITTTGGTGPGGPGGPGGGSAVTPDDTITTLTAGVSFISFPYNSTSSTTLYNPNDAYAALSGATAISGATAATYSIAATASSDNGLYYCVVTNASGSTVSNTVSLAVTDQVNASLSSNQTSAGTSPSPIITTQPASETVVTGSAASFSVVATGATSYQWYQAAATFRSPLETQRLAVSNLAITLQADTTNASAGILTGQTFSDVVMGVTSSGDGNFPFINTTPTYPTGTTGRGVLYSSLNATEQAEAVAMIEAWVNTQASDVAASLLADYLSPSALAQTYVGYQVGAGIADGTTTSRANFDPTINQEAAPINSQNSYIRVDGPRVWIEFVVQAAVAYKAYGFVHYHSLWRDKLADYGNEFGGYLDTTSTDTTYVRPTITVQPAATSVAIGNSATFAVTATGTGTLAYQWYFGSTPISGATSASYTVTNATSASAGTYFVDVSNAYGIVMSSTAALTVTTATGETSPTITTQPISQSATVGNSVSFSVAATGSGTLAYQWYKDSVSISGATAATYTIAAVALTDAGSYTCVVSNDVGSVTSSAATLTVNSATGTTPTITTQPVSQSITAGNGVTFMVAASGSGTLAYQWYFDGTAIAGATNPTYSIAAVATTDAGTYYCLVSNTIGAVKSNDATLTVVTSTGATTPTITTQPVSLTVATEQSATFSVTATGSGTLSYQWYKGGVAVSGATNSTFTITSVASTDAGSYTVVVTNSVGSVTSTAATLTIASAIPVVNVLAGSVDETTEDGGKGFFVFTRTGADTTNALTVFYKVKGTATNGTRFTGPGGVALSGSAVIPAGAAKLKLKIKAVNDSVYEGTEKAKLVLKAPSDSSYTLGTSTRAVVFVLDND